jgi:hypothetical protein
VLVPPALAPLAPKPQTPSLLLPFPRPAQQPPRQPPVPASLLASLSPLSAVLPLLAVWPQPPPVLPLLDGPQPALPKLRLPRPAASLPLDPLAAAMQLPVSAVLPQPQDAAVPQRYSVPGAAAEQSFSVQASPQQGPAGASLEHLPPAQPEPRSPQASPQPAPTPLEMLAWQPPLRAQPLAAGPDASPAASFPELL